MRNPLFFDDVKAERSRTLRTGGAIAARLPVNVAGAGRGPRDRWFGGYGLGLDGTCWVKKAIEKMMHAC